MSGYVNCKPSPYGLYRSLPNKYGHTGYWQYFVLNADGTYYRDANGDYVYDPIWIEQPTPQQSVVKQKNNKRKGNTN